MKPKNNSNKKKSKKGSSTNPPDEVTATTMYSSGNSTNNGGFGVSAEAASRASVPVPSPVVQLLTKEIQVQWEAAMALKVLGNESFGKKEYQVAVEYYTKGIDLCSSSSSSSSASAETTTATSLAAADAADAVPTVRAEMELQLRANRAQVYLKLGQWNKAEADCTAIIDFHQTSAAAVTPSTMTIPYKVWYRRALARESLAHALLHKVTDDDDDPTSTNTISAPAATMATRYLGGAKRDLQECLASVTAVGIEHEVTDTRSTVVAVAVRLQKLVSLLDNPDVVVATTTMTTTATTATIGPQVGVPGVAMASTNEANLRKTASAPPLLYKHSKDPIVTSSTIPPASPPSRRFMHPPLSTVPPATQQREDVWRLLESNQSGIQIGEALFLIEWDWWCDWCEHVAFFGPTTRNSKPPSRPTSEEEDTKMMVDQDDDGGGDTVPMVVDNNANTIQETMHRLRLLPPGAVLPDPSDHDDDCDSPGPIDNSSLLLPHPKDAAYQRSLYKYWYRDYYYNYWHYGAEQPAVTVQGNEATPTTPVPYPPLALKPGLVRGHHYELLPREVYQALRLWYSELTPSICRRAAACSGSNNNGKTTITISHHAMECDSSSTASLKNASDNGVRVCLYPLYPNNAEMPVKALSGPCGACGAPGAGKRCTQCLAVFYCDRNCQENVWKSHKIECRKNSNGKDKYLLRSNGRTGLNNLGNTCFMNSALQCLSHATPLTRHFLSGRFKADINDTNPLGTGGKLAHSYEDVMKALHNGTARSYSPTLLKRSIAMFAPRFAGCLQHDAQEFLAYLLDGLHEDLNRIRQAPYVEMPDVTDGQCIAVAGARAWDAHRRRNDSLVLDTFYGQFRSTCVCPTCNRVSVSFDAFNHVSLEIPQEKNAIVSVSVIVFGAVSEASGAAAPQPVRYSVQTRRSNSIGDFKENLAALCGIPKGNLELCEYQNHAICSVCPDKSTVAEYAASDLAAYEVQPYGDVEMPTVFQIVVTHRVVDVLQHNQPTASDTFGLPIMTSISVSLTCREVWAHMWALVGRLVSTDDGFDATSLLQLRVVTYQGKPRNIFPILDDCVDPEPEATGKMSSVVPRNCDDSFLSFVGAEQLKKNYLFLHFEWSDASDNDEIDQPKFRRVDENRFGSVVNHASFIEATKKEREKNAKKGVSLDQCFETFTKPERLDEHNMWYCSSCKEHVQAMKTMELWKLPNLLIVHLKRFEFKHALRRDKLDTLVDFPLEGLDLSAHCASSTNSFVDDQVPAVYDCFAVVNHFGRMGFGHYTAYARSWDETAMSNEWALFDDSSVRSAGDGTGCVVSPAAYVLLYRRRVFF
jgi:ubiquitin C-terminal hydrolase